MGDTLGTGIFGRFVERRAEQADLDEVVEVAGLEAGVLPVVGEAQELRAPLGQGVLPPQLPDDRERENRGRRAPAFRAESRQLAEIGVQPEPVRDAAVQAEPERRGQEVTVESIIRFACVGADPDRTRQLLPADRAALGTCPRCSSIQSSGSLLNDGIRIGGPRLGGADVKETGLFVSVGLEIRRALSA